MVEIFERVNINNYAPVLTKLWRYVTHIKIFMVGIDCNNDSID